jgi:hypothetical protein
MLAADKSLATLPFSLISRPCETPKILIEIDIAANF